MAQTAINQNILGANLLNGATSWSTHEHCWQDLLIIVSRDEVFPSHMSALGYKVYDTDDLSFIAGVMKNTIDNWEEANDLYPSDDYIVYHGCLRGSEVCFHLS